MDVISRMVNHLATINSATLSGAIDVVFVKQEDDTFLSTDFHVRFGKIGVVWSGQKIIDIEINGTEVEDLYMVLDDYGVAHFPPGLIGVEDKVPESDVVSELYDASSTLSKTSQVSSKTLVRKMSKTDDDISLRPPPLLSRQRSRHSSDPEINLTQDRSDQTSDPLITGSKDRMRRLRLTEDQMKNLNINMGCNEIVFSITTKFQGTARCSCNMFVWQQSDRVVISDIDGTITRSDVRGQFLTYMGLADWAQCSVTKLFTKISDNGYRLLYLSARPITMAGDTRTYLNSLKQGLVNLPPGPLFLNPQSSLQSFKMEVIDRQPEVFKISCLSNLCKLFTCSTPYLAGYGNRPNDVTAYQAVGIPKSRIFLIDKSGDLRGQVCLTSVISSYSGHCDLVDLLFPPTTRLDHMVDYWRDPVLDIDPLLIPH